MAAAVDAPLPPARAAFVAGPGLPGAVSEVHAAAGAWRAATGDVPLCLAADRATVAAVGAAMEAVGCLHLCAHGRLRVDNPTFSSVALADGPLTGFDIDRLSRAPTVVVLGACDIGTSVDTGGGEVIGL